MFVNKPYGSLIWGMKLFGLPPELAAKHDAWAPLGVVQGPTEPGNLSSIFRSLNDFFYAHDPGAHQSARCRLIQPPGRPMYVQVAQSTAASTYR